MDNFLKTVFFVIQHQTLIYLSFAAASLAGEKVGQVGAQTVERWDTLTIYFKYPTVFLPMWSIQGILGPTYVSSTDLELQRLSELRRQEKHRQ